MYFCQVMFSCTSAGGNMVKVKMKAVEKLAYIETRIMQFFSGKTARSSAT